MKSTLIVVGRFLLEIILVSVVTAVLQRVLTLDTYQGIIMGMLLFVCLRVIEIGLVSSKIADLAADVTTHIPIWSDVRNIVLRLNIVQDRLQNANKKAQGISDGLKLVVRKDRTPGVLFAKWYDDRLAEILNHISHTIETDSLAYEAFVIREQDRFFSVFEGKASDFFWATSSCKGIVWFLTPNGDVFLRAIDKRFQQGLIKSVRRLFIYSDPSELGEYNTRLCLFLHETSGYDYKIIKESDYNAIFRGYGDSTLVPDYGIYGDHFVWETAPESQPIIQVGRICQNQTKLTSYMHLFEALWSNAQDIQISDPSIRGSYATSRIDSLRKYAKQEI